MSQGNGAVAKPRTIIEKVWDNHVVAEREGAPALLYIDLHLVHEVTSPQAFSGLRERGLKVRRPDLTIGTTDHSIPTHDRSLPIIDKIAEAQITQFEKNCREFGIPFYGPHSDKQGIVHIIGPEQGLTQPGMTVVCGDSHTATHGAFGALAFGIGTSQVEHVLASQCLLQTRSKTYEVRVEGSLKHGVGAKDIILNLISRIGIGGGTGCVFEYSGSGNSFPFHGRTHDDLQYVHRRRCPGWARRAGRHDVRIHRRTALCPQRRRLGPSPERLASIAYR